MRRELLKLNWSHMAAINKDLGSLLNSESETLVKDPATQKVAETEGVLAGLVGKLL